MISRIALSFWLFLHLVDSFFGGDKSHSENLLSFVYPLATVLRPLCNLVELASEDRLDKACRIAEGLRQFDRELVPAQARSSGGMKDAVFATLCEAQERFS